MKSEIENQKSELSSAYALLAALLRDGVTPRLLPLLRTLPGLAEALPNSYDADEAAAAHYRLWQYNLHPYASLFLTTDGLLGGAASEEALSLYHAIGLAGTPQDSADHLATALDALSHATASPAPLLAWLLRWLPPLGCAAVRQRDPLAGAVVGMALALVTEHAASLGIVIETWSLPDVADPLTSAKSGLRDIAAYLATPPACGFAISRDEISALGRRLGAPTGFGSRGDMLETLLRSAAEFDRWSDLMAALRAIVQGDAERLASLPAPLQRGVAPWRARLAATEAMLERLGGEAEG